MADPSEHVSFDRRLDATISANHLGEGFYAAYVDISGDRNGAHYHEARDHFAGYLEKTSLKYLTEKATNPVVLFHAWKSFLLEGGGSPPGTPGSERLEATANPPSNALSIAPAEEGGLLVSTLSGNRILLGLPLHRFQQSPPAKGAAIIVPALPPDAKDARPIPMQLGATAMVNGEPRDFGFVLEAGALTLLRYSESIIGIFERDAASQLLYLGPVHLVYGQMDEPSSIAAWNRHIDLLFQRAQAIRGMLEKMGPFENKGNAAWEKLTADEKSLFISELAAFKNTLEEGFAFLAGNERHPFQDRFFYRFFQAERAQILGSADYITSALGWIADGSIIDRDLEGLQLSFTSLFTPRTYLDATFQQQSPSAPFLSLSTSPAVSEFAVRNPIALRKLFTAIAFEVGRVIETAGGKADLRFDASVVGEKAYITIQDHNNRGILKRSLSPERLDVLLKELGATLTFREAKGEAVAHILLEVPIVAGSAAALQRGFEAQNPPIATSELKVTKPAAVPAIMPGVSEKNALFLQTPTPLARVDPLLVNGIPAFGIYEPMARAVYEEVCGNGGGFKKSGSRFIELLKRGGIERLRIAGDILKGKASPKTVEAAYRQFLGKGRGCEEDSPGFRRFAAAEKKPAFVEVRDHLPESSAEGIRSIALVGLDSSTNDLHFSPAPLAIPAAGPLIIDGVPQLWPLGNTVFVNGEERPFHEVLTIPLSESNREGLDKATLSLASAVDPLTGAINVFTPPSAWIFHRPSRAESITLVRGGGFSSLQLFFGDTGYAGTISAVPLFQEAVRRIDHRDVFFRAWRDYASVLIGAAAEAHFQLKELEVRAKAPQPIAADEARLIIAPLRDALSSLMSFYGAGNRVLQERNDYAFFLDESQPLYRLMLASEFDPAFTREPNAPLSADELHHMAWRLETVVEPLVFLHEVADYRSGNSAVEIVAPTYDSSLPEEWNSIAPEDPVAFWNILHLIHREVATAASKAGYGKEKKVRLVFSFNKGSKEISISIDWGLPFDRAVANEARELPQRIAEVIKEFHPQTKIALAPRVGMHMEEPTRPFKAVIVYDGTEELIAKQFSEAIGADAWKALGPEGQAALITEVTEETAGSTASPTARGQTYYKSLYQRYSSSSITKVIKSVP